MSVKHFWWPVDVKERGGFVTYQKLPCTSKEYRYVMRALAHFARRPALIHNGGKP